MSENDVAKSGQSEQQKLTIGQMAEGNCVSKKTLRFYHDHGLLTPDIVDERNRRRYYSPEQRYVLDLIQRLQAIGLSLDSIKNVLSSNDDDVLDQAIQQQINVLEQEQVVLASKHEVAQELHDGIRSRMLLGKESAAFSVQKTWEGEWPMVVFSCEELGMEPLRMRFHSCSTQWQELLFKVKHAVMEILAENDIAIPIPLSFRNVGLIGSRTEYMQEKGIYRQIFVKIDPYLASVIERSTILPAGNYLSITGECLKDVEVCHGRCAVTWSINELFNYAARHNYKTDDCCYNTCLADPIALRERAVETLYHTRLRIVED